MSTHNDDGPYLHLQLDPLEFRDEKGDFSPNLPVHITELAKLELKA
jgi:hypothetical protein